MEWNRDKKQKQNSLVLEAPTVRVYARGINIQALTFVRVSVYGRGINYPSKWTLRSTRTPNPNQLSWHTGAA